MIIEGTAISSFTIATLLAGLGFFSQEGLKSISIAVLNKLIVNKGSSAFINVFTADNNKNIINNSIETLKNTSNYNENELNEFKKTLIDNSNALFDIKDYQPESFLDDVIVDILKKINSNLDKKLYKDWLICFKQEFKTELDIIKENRVLAEALKVLLNEIKLLLNEVKENKPPEPVKKLPITFHVVDKPRNEFFTGREEYFDKITQALNKDDKTVITQVISGLGGIGKTGQINSKQYLWSLKHNLCYNSL